MTTTLLDTPLADAPLEAPSDATAVRADAVRLAGNLAEASRRLAAALDDKERLRRLLDQVLETIDAGVVLCAADGRVLAANGAAREMGAVDPAGTPNAFVLAAPLAARGEADDARPFRPRGCAGPTWVARRGRVPLPGGGEGLLLTVQDVTFAMRLEEQAARRTRLEALGRMAAEIAHEVRNPLGSLELFASLLVDELEDRPESREMAEQMLLGVRRLSGTVTHLLAAVRGRPVRRAPADAAVLAREACAALAPVAASRGVVLEAPPAGHAAPGVLDRDGVHQALLNLVGNALEVTPSGGRVRVSARRAGAEAVVEVEDSGPGVAPELRERIFEPFFTTRQLGTGLGLAVVERVALSHAGSVEVGEAPLGGALFRLTLPDRSLDEQPDGVHG